MPPPPAAPLIRSGVDSFPTLSLDAQLHPITRSVLRVQLTLWPEFTWRDKSHGTSLRWDRKGGRGGRGG